MKNIKRIIILAAILISFIAVNAYAKNVQFTQEDRDRLIRVEARIEEGLKAVNQRIDGTNKRIDDVNSGLNKRIDDLNSGLNRRIDELRDFMLWGFGILFVGMMTLIGFVLWDRRTALAPAIRKNKELEEREERLEKALREYARKEPGLAEILKNFGLM
jgi:cytochrome c-type biogenesis protein CcmH/NrfF